jgi:hypothetical protein
LKSKPKEAIMGLIDDAKKEAAKKIDQEKLIKDIEFQQKTQEFILSIPQTITDVTSILTKSSMEGLDISEAKFIKSGIDRFGFWPYHDKDGVLSGSHFMCWTIKHEGETLEILVGIHDGKAIIYANREEFGSSSHFIEMYIKEWLIKIYTRKLRK